MTDFSAKRQPKITDSRRRATRCTRAQDKAAAEFNLTRLEVQLGRKIDIEAPVITVQDHKVTYTLCKVYVDSYRIEGIPTLRSRKRPRVEENMNSRYNDPPAPSRYYNPRDRDYHDSYYPPNVQQFERRQVAKKSTAQQAQVHQYAYKRSAGPDFNRSAYNQHQDAKRPRMAHGGQDRYSRSMRPPDYTPNGVNRGGSAWSRGSSSSRYPQRDHFERRGPGRPRLDKRKDDWADDGWRENDRFRDDDQKNRQTRSRSSERGRPINTRAEESNRSHSQGPSTRSRPKSSQGNDKSNAITLPKSNQGKSSKDKGDENESKPMQGSDKISGQPGTSSSASKPPSVPKTNASDASLNNDKIKQVPSAVKLKANARKSTYSPGKVKPSDEQGNSGPDPDVEWKVLSEAKGSPSPSRKPTTRSDISDDTKQTRSPRVNHVDGRGSALDNALRIERMRKAEEARNGVEDTTNATKQPVITNSAPDTSERTADEGNIAAQNKSSAVITRTASRKLMPGPSLARKVSPTSARKTMAISSNQSKSKPTESTKDAPQTQKTSAKQGMARKSAPKSVNHKGTPPFLPFGPQNNEGDEDGSRAREENVEKESETQKAAEKIPGSTEQANGPVLSSLATNKPISDRSNLTARKSAPRSASPSKSGKSNPSTVQQPCTTSNNLPPTKTDVSADHSVNLSSEAYDASQSARTVPFKQLQSSKKPGPIVQPKPTVQSSPTARKSAPPSEQSSKKRPEIRMPIQNRLEKDDITKKPTGVIPTVKMPVPEKQNNSPEVKYAIVEGKDDVQASITGSAKNKPKGLATKTLNLSVFKKEKLKNIVGKVAAKMEARSAGDISPSAGNGPVPMKLDQDKQIVEKELAAVEENLPELQDDLVDKEGKIEVKNKVMKFQVSGEKLQVGNMAGVSQGTKSELETKESEVKQETKCPVVLKVPQIIPKDSQDTKSPNAAVKLDNADVSNAPKMDSNPVQTTTKVKEMHTVSVASTMLHLAKLVSQQSPVEKELSSDPPCQEQVTTKTSVPTISTLQKPPQMNPQSKSPDLVKLTSTTNSNITTTEESKFKSSGVITQVAKKSAAVIDKIGSNALVVTAKGLVSIRDAGATGVEVLVKSKCNERLPSDDTSKAKATKQCENASVSNIEKKPLKDGDQPLTDASKEVSLSANSNVSSPVDSSSENPTVSEGVNLASMSTSEVNVQNVKPQLKPAETVTKTKPSIDENKGTETNDPSLTVEKDTPVKNDTKGCTNEPPDGSNRNSGECQIAPKLAEKSAEPQADMARSDTPSDNRKERNDMAQTAPHLSEQNAGHSARSVSSDKPSHVSMETNEKTHPVPQVASSFPVHSPPRLNSNPSVTITGNNEEAQTTIKVAEKSAEECSPTKTKPESERKSAEGPSPASASSTKSSDAIKETIEKPYTVPQFEVKSAVARSPGRKSREGDSSDDALLNSSTNDSAEEPMEVDGDSEMEDYLLADDEIQNKEEKRDQAMDIPKDADQSLTKNESAKDSVKQRGAEVVEGMSTLAETSQPSSMPFDTSNETNSASPDIVVPEVTETSLGIQNASEEKTDSHQDMDQPPPADIDSAKDTDKSKATSFEVSERTPSLPAVSLHSPPKAIADSQNANSVETGIIPEPSINDSTSVVQDELTQKTENNEINLVPSSSSVEQSSTHANQPSTHLAKTKIKSQIHGASDAQLNDNIPNASEKDEPVAVVTDAHMDATSAQNQTLVSKGPEIMKDAVKSSETPIAKDINIVESKTAKGSETETTLKLPSDEKKLPVILSVTSKDNTTNSPNTSISVNISEASTTTKLKDVTLVNASEKPLPPKSTEDTSVQESSEKMPSKSTGDTPLKGAAEETSLKSDQNSSVKLISDKTPSKSTEDISVEVVSGKMPLKSAEHSSGNSTSAKVVSPQSTENTLVKVTSDIAVPSKSTPDVLGKVTSEKTILPKRPSEDQSKSSRSATPSAESAGESGVDIIELSSDEDATSASSAAIPKPKKKKLKSKSSTESHGKSGKRSASPFSDGKENKKAKLDGSEKQDTLSPNLSKQELVAKLIEIKMRQHLKRVNELAAKAKILQDQLTAAENSRQRWQIESTRLQIKVHELTEQNDILRSKRKEVPSKVVVTTGTQYDRQDVLQAQQLLAAKQSAAIVPTMQTSSTFQRMPQQQHPQSSNKESTTVNSVPPNRSVASDASKSNVLTSSRAAAVPQTRPLNASSQASASTTATNMTATTSGSGSKTPSTPGSTPTKQPSNRCGWQQSQPLNLHSSSISPTATPFGVNATDSTYKTTAIKNTCQMLESGTSRKSSVNNKKTPAPPQSTSKADLVTLCKSKSARNLSKLSSKVNCRLCMPSVTKTSKSSLKKGSRLPKTDKVASKENQNAERECSRSDSEENPKSTTAEDRRPNAQQKASVCTSAKITSDNPGDSSESKESKNKLTTATDEVNMGNSKTTDSSPSAVDAPVCVDIDISMSKELVNEKSNSAVEVSNDAESPESASKASGVPSNASGGNNRPKKSAGKTLHTSVDLGNKKSRLKESENDCSDSALNVDNKNYKSKECVNKSSVELLEVNSGESKFEESVSKSSDASPNTSTDNYKQKESAHKSFNACIELSTEDCGLKGSTKKPSVLFEMNTETFRSKESKGKSSLASVETRIENFRSEESSAEIFEESTENCRFNDSGNKSTASIEISTGNGSKNSGNNSSGASVEVNVENSRSKQSVSWSQAAAVEVCTGNSTLKDSVSKSSPIPVEISTGKGRSEEFGSKPLDITQAGTRPGVPTAKPADVRAKSSATRRPSGSQSKSSEPVAVIDLTDDDDAAAAAAAAAAANKNKVPLNPVRTPPVTQPSRVSQQNTVPSKSPPVAHTRTTPPRPVPPAARQSPTMPNILRNKPAQQVIGQSATNQIEEFRQAAQRQQKQVQIIQRQLPAPPTLQQRQVQQPQRSVAAQQAAPNLQVVHTSQQARVSPMQSSSRAVTVSTGGTRQIVSLPANNLAATAAIASRATAPQILQQSSQQQQVVQHQVLQQQASVVQQQIVQQQVVSPGQAAQIIQTPAGQVVMTPMSSSMATVLTTQPIQAGAVHPGQLTTYQIQTVPGQAIQNASTVQQMLMQQQQPRTAQVVQQQQQQVATRFTAPANSLQPSSSVQQAGHVIHHRGNTSRPPHTMSRPTNPNALPQQPPPPYQQRRPSFSDPGTVRAVAAPPVTVATSAVPSTADVQQQFAQIQTQISQYEALAQNMQQSIQKLKEEDAPYEKRRIEILKELQMGNLGTYRTQDLHMQLRHIQNEQTRIQTESKSKVNLMQQYLHSKHQLQQSLQQHQRQQAVQQSQQQQQAVQPTVQQQQQQIVQVSQSNRPAVTQIAASNSTTATSQSSQVAVRRHPAPLPSVPNSAYTVASNAAPPPKPSLSISKVNQGIVLSWNMTINTAVHAAIDFYNLYAYQETDAPPNTSLWKKIGEVKALPLPMACTLTQFQPGSMYHFAVCAIDVYHRTGPFSDPSSINLPAL